MRPSIARFVRAMASTFPVMLVAITTILLGGAASAEPEDSRHPIPEAAVLAAAEKLVADVYKDDLAKAKTEETRTALAERMIADVGGQANDAAAQYAGLCRARDLAVDAANATLAMQAIDLLRASFDVQSREMIVSAFQTMTTKTHPTAKYKGVAESAAEVAGRFGDDCDWDAAAQLQTFAVAAARKSRDGVLTKQLVDEQAKLVAAKKQSDQVTEARKTLEQSPDDAAANSTLGRYLCFVDQDWPAGFACLAKGNDPALKELAAHSVAVSDEPNARVAVGDAWWDAADKAKGKDKEQLHQAAGYWYALAVDGLTGLAKTRVEKRLGELGSAPPPKTSPTTASAKPATKSASKLPPANGLAIAETLDCSEQKHTYTIGKTFDVSKSWTLAFEFYPAADADNNMHRMFYWEGGESGGIPPINVGIRSNKVWVALQDVRDKNDDKTATAAVFNPVQPTWIPLVVKFDAVLQKVNIYIGGGLLADKTVGTKPFAGDWTQIDIGGRQKDGERFLGKIRNVWLSNDAG